MAWTMGTTTWCHTGSARALHHLRDEMSFLERIVVGFIPKNVDEKLRAAAIVEDEICGHTQPPHGAQPGCPQRPRPVARIHPRSESRNRSRSPLARRGNDNARPAPGAEEKDKSTAVTTDRSASDPLALEEAEMPAEL